MQAELTDFKLFDTEIKRHDNQRDTILNLLKKHDFVPTARLRLFAYQYNTRIFELRRIWYNIISLSQNGKRGYKLEV